MTTTSPRRSGTKNTIGKNVLYGYFALMAILFLVVIVAVGSIRYVSDAKSFVIEHNSVLVSRTNQLDAILWNEVSNNRGFYLTGDEKYLTNNIQLEAEYTSVIADITAEIATAEKRSLLQQLQSAKDEWMVTVNAVNATTRSGATAAEIEQAFTQEDVSSARDTLHSVTQQLVDLESAAIPVAISVADDSANSAMLILWVMAGVAFILSFVIAWWVNRGVSRRLSVMSRQIEGAAAEILAGTTQQVTGFSEQAAAVQETVATVQELVQTAEQSVERARMVAELARQSSEVAQAGMQAVENSADGMNSIREQVHGIAENVVSMTEHAQAIAGIIETVNGIAEQTHILALNAAIEAARAGEHGRGFGVVAAEVKVLADQSRRATAQVSGILGDIQRSTNTAVMFTEAGTKSVDEGTRLVALAGSTIENLTETVATAAVATEQIAASSNQQALATSQISHAMKDVDTVMEQNLASSRQSEQAAKALTGVVAAMKALVGTA